MKKVFIYGIIGLGFLLAPELAIPALLIYALGEL